MRQFRFLASLGLAAALLVLGADSTILIGPVKPGPIRLVAVKEAAKPDFVDGKLLRFQGAWTLKDAPGQFGGVSALAVSGNRFLALGDDGALYSFTFDGIGQPRDARISGLPLGCGHRAQKKDHDSESMVIDAARARMWIGFEWYNRICRIVLDGAMRGIQTFPAAMQAWPKTGGAEAMVRLEDGRFAVFAERPEDESRNSPVLLFPADPVAHPKPVARLWFSPPEGYRVSDAAMLPDGRMLVLVRSFTYPFAFKARLQIVDTPGWRSGVKLTGRDIVRLEGSEIGDNFEAIAIDQAEGSTRIWLASDDNSLPLQKSWLLKFELSR